MPIKVPTMKFVKKGVLKAGSDFKAVLEAQGGEVGAQMALIDLDGDLKMAPLVREFSKLMQVQIIASARKKIVPVLERQIDGIGLPNRVILAKVKEIVYDLAEKILRKAVNDKVRLSQLIC